MECCRDPTSAFIYFSHKVKFIALTLLLFVHSTYQQTTLRNFPPLFNVAKERPLSGSPTLNTCGATGRSAYCKSSTYASSVNADCRQDFCVQDCPYRSSLPTELNLIFARGFGTCVNSDTVNIRRGSRVGDYSVVFGSGPQCFITPISTPSLGPLGAMTLTLWVWQGPTNMGTVLEKWSQSRATIFKLRVSNQRMVFQYRTSGGIQQIQISESFSPNTWTFIALQIYDRTISYYINGVGAGGAPSGTSQLSGQIQDESGSVRVGQDHDGADQFIGRLQDMKFFSDTLTNREIQEMYSGVLPPVFIQSECRCPPDHPRVRPAFTKYCIRNGVPDNIGEMVLRLNNYSLPLGYINDGDSNSFWVSSFFDDVTLTLDLQDQFQVFYIVMQFYSPLPKAATIERRLSPSGPWEFWQYYAYDCEPAFGFPNNGPLPLPNSVNCIQFGTNGLQVPYSKGNITFSVLASEPVSRPGQNDFYNSPRLFEFVKASQIRVRLREHYYVTHPRHKYYGVYELIVTGRCNCYGHATNCDTTQNPYICNCLPDSFTQGTKCDQCQPLYNNKPFIAGDQVNPYNCKPCECHGHADRCVYNATLDPFPDNHEQGGGGVCVDCRDNTIGQRCDVCRPLYFRPAGKSLFDQDVCSECDCFAAGVEGSSMDCEKEGGQCSCRANVEGRQCDRCRVGFFNLLASNPKGCEECNCFAPGAKDGAVSCHQAVGQCDCKDYVRNTNCNACDYGFYNLTASNPKGCDPCNCNPAGSSSQFCDPQTGQCQCKERVTGRLCNQCEDGFYNFTAGCVPCSCDADGSIFGTTCDKDTGECQCKLNVRGAACNECEDGFYGLSASILTGCRKCNCNEAGVEPNSTTCNKDSGDCECKPLVTGRACDECMPYAFDLTATNADGCRLCGCDPSGSVGGDTLPPDRLECDDRGQCSCLSHRSGIHCEICDSGYFLNNDPGGGCFECQCQNAASEICNAVTGACTCTGGKIGKFCDQCPPRTYIDSRSNFCQPCNCEMAGSLNDTCDTTTGACFCKKFVTGNKCNECVNGTSNLQLLEPFGCTKAPSQQPPPNAVPISSTALRVFWEPPDHANGEIKNYTLYRDNVAVVTVKPSVREYNDTNLDPFTEYLYSVEARNDQGTARSPPVTLRTPAGSPAGSLSMEVTNIQARSAILSWNQPDSPNGLIQYYRVNSTTSTRPNPITHIQGLFLSVRLTDLEPFMIYTFVVSACTLGGCLDSPGVIAETRSDIPEGQSNPDIEPLTETSLYISWTPPDYPNGIIIYYELWMRGMEDETGQRNSPPIRIFHPSGSYIPRPTLNPGESAVPPPSTNYTVGGLEPFTQYEFQVLSENSIGKAASPWTVSRTLEAVPLSMPAPAISPLTSSSLQIAWRPPNVTQARGVIVSYNIYYYQKTDLSLDRFAPPYVWQYLTTVNGSEYVAQADGFLPYTNHTFIVEACNSAGCVNSSTSSGFTDIAAPEDMGRLFVGGYNATAIKVEWHPPEKPNSPIVRYEVSRITPAFNFPPPTVQRGTRFPGGGFYRFAPDIIPQGVTWTGFEISFKTGREEGLILYAASPGQTEVLFVQVLLGRVYFLFDAGRCWYKWATTDDEGLAYNDNSWHRFTARRNATRVYITMDGKYTGNRSEICDVKSDVVGDNTGVFIGGVPSDLPNYRTAIENIGDDDLRVSRNFEGCITDFRILTQLTPAEKWTVLDFDDAEFRSDAMPQWEGCPIGLDDESIHFLGTGYMLSNRVYVRASEFRVKFRTELSTALLVFYPSSGTAYWFVKMEGDRITTEQFNGSQSIRLEATSPQPLCDGQWHELTVKRAAMYMSIKIDRNPEVRNGLDRRITIWSRLRFDAPANIGGIKPQSTADILIKNLGIEDKLTGAFAGCMHSSAVLTRGSNLDLGGLTDNRNVRLDGCPAKYDSSEQCRPTLKEVIYNGLQNITYDNGLLPYTEYVYQVIGYNEDGKALSNWFSGRTLAGAPTGVQEPLTAVVRSGYLISVTWAIPPEITGVFTMFKLMAYNQDNSSIPPVVTEFKLTNISAGNITEVTPATNYLIKFVACTDGGCTESMNGARVRTFEEEPEGVLPPVAEEVGGSYISVSWKPPSKINGDLTGYFLVVENVEKYSGALLRFNVTDLQVYTGYRFVVQACTQAGCTSSPVVNLQTAQLPPSFVAAPSLTVLGPKRMRVDWTRPEQLNGVLDRYLIRASTIINDVGSVVYNSTEKFLFKTVDGLIPGTTYYFRVSACTAGGCRLSEASSATTVESAPEGIKEPNVTSPSPTELIIRWSEPQLPNGIILQYRLYHNGLMVYNTSSDMQYTIQFLLPWSLHEFRVEACTVRGCGSSDIVQARTQEAPPQGVVGMELQVLDSRSAMVKWNAPAVANGLLYYDVFFYGIFYVDPEKWDYSVQDETKSLFQTTTEVGDWITIEKLIPYTEYQVYVNASNSKGFILSNTLPATMPPGSPDGVKPPVAVSPTSTSIKVTWDPVGRKNFIQEPVFQLQFKDAAKDALVEDIFDQPTTSTSYMKMKLLPFTEYYFRVVASNSYGETRSEWVSVTTMEDKPSVLQAPVVNNVGSRSVELVWNPPDQMNGVIRQIQIFQNGAQKTVVDGNATQLTIADLIPFNNYTYKISYCTSAGCSTSTESTVVRTLKASPEGLTAPTLVSETPTSVLVRWSPPSSPNGEIMTYTLERRPVDNDGLTTVTTQLASLPLLYTDRDAVLSPFTTYEYRVIAASAAGNGYSAWASVTTRSSSPGGVRPPFVVVLNATSANISWAPPIKPNGLLEYYTVKLPEPRFTIRDVNQTSLVVVNLTPFTEYRISVIACSDGGCTESVPTIITTNPSLPAGQQAPMATSHSQSYISILWLAPQKTNGPNIRYELQRSKIRQPLDPSADGFNSWVQVYIGSGTYYEDRGLTIFTTYQYRVTVYNDYGQITSDPSEDATTFGGTPSKPATVYSDAINHTSVQVRWEIPDVFELQGGVVEYEILLMSPTESKDLEYGPEVTQTIVGDLMPSTRYEFRVRLTVHGGAKITSLPAFATTLDGAPEGLPPPQLLTLNDTTLQIMWTAPQRPNGEVIGYYIYVNNKKLDTGTTIPGSYIVYDLIPYTIYTIQMEVCTEFACSRSDAIIGTTAEALPSGLYPPTTQVKNPNTVRISWIPPADPNGIVLRYDLLRRDKLPCNLAPPTTTGPPPGKCQYLECELFENFCGEQCYSGPKTCCKGSLYQNQANYECCDNNYIPRRNNPNDVCCGGQFYTPLANHQCCGGRYVSVRAGQICCPDTSQDRVDIGNGDACCGRTPFYVYGSQLCCNGELVDKLGHQCCGGQVVDSNLVCCGNSTSGMAYDNDPKKICCGASYNNVDTSVCCTDYLGYSKVHMYRSAAEKQSSNEKCCGIERISSQLSCCTSQSYNSGSQSCADISEMQNGCGQGTICPVSARTASYCDRCDFDRSQHKCGSYIPKPMDTPKISGDPSGLCWTSPIRILSGLNFSFTDTNLEPYTEYEYAVAVVNGAGSALSDYITALTLPKKPQEVQPPRARVDSSRLDTIFLSWDPPGKPNGIIRQYVILRDGVEMFRDQTRREYMDNNAIQPYQTYSYVLRVCTNPGCTDSTPVNVATLQTKPDELFPPVVTSLSPSILMVIWRPPKKPNGYIIQYRLVEVTLQRTTNFTNTDRQYNITGTVERECTGLKPYTQYEVRLTACTSVGCTNSTSVKQYTMEALPDGMPLPRVVIMSSTSLELHWQSPKIPNGKIGTYLVYFHLKNQSMPIVIYTAPAYIFQFTITGLNAGERYSYSVEARNTAGGTLSGQVGLTLPLSSPLGIQAPTNVTVLGPRSLMVEWDVPTGTPEDQIDQYLVVLNAGQPNEVSEGVGISYIVIIDNLKPFTEYDVRIRGCLINVPVGCATGPGKSVRTTEAEPQNQRPPDLYAQGPSVVQVSWDEPKDPNGIIIQYRIHRRKKSDGGRGLLINVLTGNTQTYIDAGPELIAFTEYEYQLTAVNTQGETVSDWSAVKTHQAPPTGMTPPVVSMIDAYGAKVSWQAPSLPNGLIKQYNIEWREQLAVPTIQRPSKVVTLESHARETTISGLQPYTKYQIRVKVVNGAGELATSWSSFTTDQASPAEIQSFSVEKISSGRSVILRWEPPLKPNGRITNYLIYEEGNINAIYQGLTRVFEYRRLDPFASYTIQLEVCTVSGCGRSGLQTFMTAEVPPDNQPAPSFGSVNATHIVIKWTKPINSNGKILRYEVLRKVQSLRVRRDATPKIVYSTEDTDAENYEYVDSNLKPYSKYEYKIRATNAQGSTESPWQGVETAQAAPNGVKPPVVTLLNEYNKLRITWLEPSEPNGVINMYQLQRNDSVPWSFSSEMPKEYTDAGLLPFTTYSYTIKACTAIANGCTVSPPTLITTKESSPYFVSPPTLTVLGPTAIRAQWTPPQITNGQIKEYRLNLDNVTQYTGSSLQYTVTGLTPYKGYNFVLSACTTGGCKDSVAVLGRPSEAIPGGMKAPTLRVTSSTSIEISWEAPEQPNGVITSYEVRRDNVLVDSTNALQFTDYAVRPGMEYSYTVTAFNSKGSVTSAAAMAVTYSSSPSGMNPPVLEALSSTSIRASWKPPDQPNGAIHNYTLYVNSSIRYSERGMFYTVDKLDPWTVYLFRIEACTSSGCATSNIASLRTMQGAPMGMRPPKLTPFATSTGAHDGILCEWLPPQRPNGNITKYELFRRDSTGLPADVTGPRTSIYTGRERRYIDKDPLLQPFTRYEYMVRVQNAKGIADSVWSGETTKEGPPEGVIPPRVKSSTPTTITLEVFDPVKPNGLIINTEVFVDGVRVFQGHSTRVILGEDVPLEPFREYEVFIRACTAGGCTSSDPIKAKTSSQRPLGLKAPILSNATKSSIDVSWSEPSQKNGVNLQYELLYRQACPPPYAVPGGPVQITCVAGDWISNIRGVLFRATVQRLQPYTTYEFQVEVSNEAGNMEDAPVASAHTLKAAPQYRRNQPPEIRPSGNLLVVDWSKSFFVNGDIVQFALFVDQIQEYTGYSATYNIFRQSLYKSYKLKVTLETDQGTASSPLLIFDPSSPTIIAAPTSPAPAGGSGDQPFYQQVWFIVVVSILILIILFVSLACCLRSTRQKVPYIRERMPLHPPQKIPLDYGMDLYGSSMDSMEMPPGPVTLQRGPPSVTGHSALHSPALPHVGYINPAFAQMQHPNAGLLDLNLDDKLSHKSSKWEDDDDWDINLPPDSGLHSLAYGEEYDAASDRPISVLKEHTMFTDTHL